MIANRLRPPIRLPQHAEGGSNSCIAAQIEYVFGLVEVPDPFRVDRLARRRSGASLPEMEVAFYLLKTGFRCQLFTSDTDEGLLKLGLTHIKRVHGKDWGPDQIRYFTSSRVAQLQRIAHSNIMRKQTFGNEYSEIGRNAQPGEITGHLSLGHVISFVTTERNGGPVRRKGLLVPSDKRTKVWLYLPSQNGQLKSGLVDIKTLPKMMSRDWPVVAYWH